MKKVELLAPAGNYESFLGAIHAGADAVYLGGSKFGARAYANNFTDEEIRSAIKYAHLYGKKVYLTVNTLIKEYEFSDIYLYLKPFYEAGLDAVIVQDVGVFRAIGKWFQDLDRHISTQMTVTGSYGAYYLKELGATRIVPARELSIDEIKSIKQDVNIEIETFVHGAICYCYSGQCLFSSILGGRSGNRGRCAQPCRLPYHGDMDGKKDIYPLSLKDMCTIEIIPELIDSCIDSFKIEGRMKSSEYVAGVTALYRKYIDKYYENPKSDFHVSKKDMDRLKALYIRSEISEGYYHRHNGKSMITLKNPSYSKRDDELVQEIREKYIGRDNRLPVQGKALLYKGKPAQFSITCKETTVVVEGNIVEPAVRQPLEEAGVKKQLRKSGNTIFTFEHIEVDMEQGIFMPVKAINDLRRIAINELETKLIEKNGFEYLKRKDLSEYKEITVDKKLKSTFDFVGLQVLVQNKEQLLLTVNRGIQRIYVSSDICGTDGEIKYLRENKDKTAFYLAMPYIIRKNDEKFLHHMKLLLENDIFRGVLIRNLEELQWLKEMNYSKPIITDANMYIWNHSAYDFFNKDTEEHFTSYELNYREITALKEKIENNNLSHIVYGRIPMMITANCVERTLKGCLKESSGSFRLLEDRYHKLFPVYLNCRHCYNIIYNTVPLSLHQNISKLEKLGIHSFRLDFTTETVEEADKIMSYYESILYKDKESISKGQFPFSEYTNGHLKRGVE